MLTVTLAFLTLRKRVRYKQLTVIDREPLTLHGGTYVYSVPVGVTHRFTQRAISNSKVSQNPEEEEKENNRLSALEAWADRVEGVWNEILHADAVSSTPRITLPGFPIEVMILNVLSRLTIHLLPQLTLQLSGTKSMKQIPPKVLCPRSGLFSRFSRGVDSNPYKKTTHVLDMRYVTVHYLYVISLFH